jgi:hypothetical protein
LATAQKPDARSRADAQKLYEDGAKDMEADDYAHACPKFEAAWKILPDHIRTGVTLAECMDKWGKPASALSVLERVAPLAKARGDKAKIAEVEASIADLEKRVPRLTVRVSESLSKTPGLAILRDGTPLPAASWGTPVPLDPGEHEIEASAVDKPTWKTTVRLDLGKLQTVDINSGWPAPNVDKPFVPPSNTGLRTAGLVGIGLGAVGLATWGVLGGLAISKNNASKAHCNPNNICDDEGFVMRENAVAFGHGASAGLIAGGIFLAAGVTLVVLSAGGKKEMKRDAASLWISPSGMGLRGTW